MLGNDCYSVICWGRQRDVLWAQGDVVKKEADTTERLDVDHECVSRPKQTLRREGNYGGLPLFVQSTQEFIGLQQPAQTLAETLNGSTAAVALPSSAAPLRAPTPI